MNERIKKKFETVSRRNKMRVKCFELKIQENKLSSKQRAKLVCYFKEAKYFTNSIIGSSDIFNFDYKTKSVDVHWKENGEDKSDNRSIQLPSQIKQDIKTKLITDVLNLNKAKKKGYSVGRLKFRKEINTIGLKQYGITWKFGDRKSRVHIAGLGLLKVNGSNQITNNVLEFGPAKLIRKPSGYYIHITCFILPDKTIKQTIGLNDIVGLDFGIKDSITLSAGEKFKFKFNDLKIKREHKQLSKKKKGKNSFKQKYKLRKQYEKLTNRKNDIANKFVSNLKKNYKVICLQDENISGWQKGLFGKQVQQSILGRIKSRLIKSDTTIVIDRFQPTTKLCPMCGSINRIKLSDRIYKCDCGFSDDRDIKSARTIATMALDKLVPTEHREIKPVEILTAEFAEKYKMLFDNSSRIVETGSR